MFEDTQIGQCKQIARVTIFYYPTPEPYLEVDRNPEHDSTYFSESRANLRFLRAWDQRASC